jgi:hypothetical protein
MIFTGTNPFQVKISFYMVSCACPGSASISLSGTQQASITPDYFYRYGPDYPGSAVTTDDVVNYYAARTTPMGDSGGSYIVAISNTAPFSALY